MKIISKYKDYYDYLQGSYGIDETLVLDRTEFRPMPYLPDWTDTAITLFVCDFQVECLCRDGKFYYGPEIEQFLTEDDIPLQRFNFYPDYYYFAKSRLKVLKEPKKLEFSPNEAFNCPVMIETWDKTPYAIRHEKKGGNLYFAKNPILKEYAFHKQFSAEQLWIMLAEWLGKDRTVMKPLTDKQKIVSYGFDEKTSFRKMK